jgi:hypothetical protein
LNKKEIALNKKEKIIKDANKEEKYEIMLGTISIGSLSLPPRFRSIDSERASHIAPSLHCSRFRIKQDQTSR